MSSLPLEKITKNDNFDILRAESIEEYRLNATLYRHKRSGAQVMSVQADDENKVFGITFRTPPDDSTGVAHIMEHSVLCGSRKYKTKEPFVDLLKGSVNTFLNAFTYPDRTCYPVASVNTKDFYNLVDVYLDAVFYPRALQDPQVLGQEGWHYEYDKESDKLSYKGVVYNEMKGVYSSSDSLLARATQQALFPDNAYSVDSGGNPSDIPNLTFDSFKNFHATKYHPSNSRIYFYGNDDVAKRLEIIDSYLKDFSKLSEKELNSTSIVPQQLKRPLSDAVPLKIKYPIEPGTVDANGHVVTVNWLLPGSGKGGEMNSKEKLLMNILNHLLLGTSSSVLHKALTESNLGESVTGGGVSDELIQDTFSVGMKGVSETNTSKVQELILSTLESVAEKGFDEEAILASVNSIEFDLREFNTGGFPKGLSLMLGFMSNWIYDREPFEAVRFSEDLSSIKADLKSGKPVFQTLVRNAFLNNGHRVSVVMEPDLNVAAEEIEREESKLREVRQRLTDSDLQEVVNTAAQLKAAQEAEDSPSAKETIPRLALEDLDTNPLEIPCELTSRAEPVPHDLLLHDLPSSGILYADIGLDFSLVPLEDVSLLPLFARMLIEAGTTSRDQVSLSRHIDTETGGISVSWNSGLRTSKGRVQEDQTDVTLYMMMRGKCTGDKVSALFDIFADILLNAKLDNKKRAVEMMLEVKSHRTNRVVSSGHSFGVTRLASKSSFLGHLSEHMGGLTYLSGVDSLLEEMDKDWPRVEARLERIRRSLLDRAVNSKGASRPGAPASTIVNLSGDQQILTGAGAAVDAFLQKVLVAGRGLTPSSGLDSGSGLVQEWLALPSTEAKRVHEGIAVPSQVNYVVKGGQLFQPGEEVRGSHGVVSRYLGNSYLWDTIRVMGGAYGGFGRFSPHSGRYVFASYRDPNIVQTLETYDRAGEALMHAVDTSGGSVQNVPASVDGTPEEVLESGHYTLPPLTQEDITQSVIGFVGDMDSPMSTDQKGYTSMCNYIAGETADERKEWRQEVLATSSRDFHEFAVKLDTLSRSDAMSSVVVGSQSALEQANKELSGDKKLQILPLYRK